ncbi:uncharacterized protein LOC108665513 isoform X2 [Hyalella azteca]|nr:uncharacterized protein LOC108665513 isoform X2 [Hyalella azteca]
MVTFSNQTMQLMSARPVSGGVKKSGDNTKEVKTWAQQVQSPNNKPTGYTPKWIQYKKDQEVQSESPIFYERLVSGFDMTREFKDNLQQRVIQAVQRAAKQLQVQNMDSKKEPKDYIGSEDGRAAQSLHEAHKLIRALPKDDLQKIDQQLQQQAQQCQLCHDLFIEALAVAGSGASLDMIVEKIQKNEISDNRTASIFFSIANNVQSPEAIDKLLDFAMSIREETKTLVSVIVKPNLAILIRRLCVSEEEMPYSHMRKMFGDKQCDKDTVVHKYLPHLEDRIKTASQSWVRILNVLAAADLGAPESLQILEKVAKGEITDNIYVRYAAIHGMSINTFDNCTRDKIFNILQPMAESQAEDFRIRQVAFDTLLAWRPNVTFIQRMASSARREASVQVQSYIYNAIDSLAVIDDPDFKDLSSAARNMRQLTRQMSPSSHRAFTYKDSRYLPMEQVGAEGEVAWLSGLRAYFPREIYTYVVAQLGKFRVPLFESMTFGNVQSAYSYSRDILASMRRIPAVASAERQERRSKIHQQIKQSDDNDSVDIYHYSRIFKTSELFLPLSDELFSKLKETGDAMIRRHSVHAPRDIADDRYQIYKYFNPVEINVILPTPVGLFTHTEVSTPTVIYINLKSTTTLSPPGMPDSSQLPKLRKIDVAAEGIVKAVTKSNTYTYVYAPWTNKTAVAGVDNEKSLSLPMNLRLAADVRLPVQQLWAQLTPRFNQTSESIPVLKVRNVPFTGIGKVMPSPVHDGDFENFEKVRWVYDDTHLVRKTMKISADATGLNAEVRYVGEPDLPINQPNIIKLFLEPSRLVGLLASPTVKNYALTLYQNPGDAPTKKIGLALRHIVNKGTGSAPLTVEEDALKPIDIAPEDTIEERQQKLVQFSSWNNHEFSAHVNFTGGDTKIYEAAIIAVEQEHSVNSENSPRVFYKVQAALLEKNSKSPRKPKTCLMFTTDRPQLMPEDARRSPSPDDDTVYMNSEVGLNIYEGSSCKKDDQPLAKGKATLTVSDNRIKVLTGKSGKEGEFVFKNSSEFYRLAVYDQMRFQVDWQTPSPALKNVTMRIKDLAEGYLFPKIVKNRMTTNQDKRMVVRADRSISDNRVDVWIELPKETDHAERVEIQPWFDHISGFTPNIFSVYNSSTTKFLQAHEGQCHVSAEHVTTFDGVSYSKLPTACETTAVEIQRGKDKIAVTTSRYPDAKSSTRLVKILSADDGLEIIAQGQNVKINGQLMPPSEKTEEVKDESGNVIARVSKTGSTTKINLLEKILVILQDNTELLIKVDSRYKNATQGLCGGFNGETARDLFDRKSCIYRPDAGSMFAAAWVNSEEQCEEETLKNLFVEVHDKQAHHCQSLMSSSSSEDCRVTKGYPIVNIEGSTCVSETEELVCKQGCKKRNKSKEENVPFKCWHHGNVPKEVLANKLNGYMPNPCDIKEDFKKSTTYMAPHNCTSRILTAHGVGLDPECFLTAYPVSQEGPLLCTTEEPHRLCKPECRVVDTMPRQASGKCWNIDDAPQELQDAQKDGYIEKATTEEPLLKRVLAVQSARLCIKSNERQ